MCWLCVDELERGDRSTMSLESMASSHTGQSPSTPNLLAVQEQGYQALAQGIWPAVLALFLSVSTSILVFPFFPYVPSSGTFGDALPQVGPLTTQALCAMITAAYCSVFISLPLCMQHCATGMSASNRCLCWHKLQRGHFNSRALAFRSLVTYGHQTFEH